MTARELVARWHDATLAIVRYLEAKGAGVLDLVDAPMLAELFVVRRLGRSTGRSDGTALIVEGRDEPWLRIETLFLGVAKHLQAKLKNEKDILRLMAIGRQRDWRFVDDFHEFLRCRA